MLIGLLIGLLVGTVVVAFVVTRRPPVPVAVGPDPGDLLASVLEANRTLLESERAR